MTAVPQIIEAIGVSENDLAVEGVALLASDSHSTQGYGGDPLVPGTNPATWTYSYERWFRVQLSGDYVSVGAYRIWVPGLVIPDGWEVHFGTTTSYATPVDTASAIATGPVPTSDPGPTSPNAGGSSPTSGPGTAYSDWIVLQARARGGQPPGPILGFDYLGVALPLLFEFHWSEG